MSDVFSIMNIQIIMWLQKFLSFFSKFKFIFHNIHNAVQSSKYFPSYSASSFWVCDGLPSNNDFKASVFAVRGVPECCWSLTSKSPNTVSNIQLLRSRKVRLLRPEMSLEVVLWFGYEQS
uniref:Ovule protein n=1 Tax=Heterorhabditis bacteriophora TaxID=37862 RepID=A0A1I7X4G9_HETBA